jgi:hypothetical protein
MMYTNSTLYYLPQRVLDQYDAGRGLLWRED